MVTWRERFLIGCGPGVLAGITLGDWLALLRENQFSVDLPYLPRAASISFAAVMNSAFRWYEDRRFRREWQEIHVPPPIFVLGHWRSGTTHLHYLLGLDDRFAFPNLYQVHYPHTFLSTERNFSSFTGFLLPRSRPYDNVRLDLNVPDEDEFAMCVLGFMSPYLFGVFARRAEYYDQFLTFRQAPEAAIEKWKSSLLVFLKKLAFKYGKPLIVKSPTHTCRIKLLLEMFPTAKFVHIHRDPYAVFQSSLHTMKTGIPFGRLQRTDHLDWTERTIRQYKKVYDVFFEERGLIGAGRLHEVCFEDLERDPLGEVQKIYTALGLPEFSYVEPRLRSFVEAQSDYRKNTFSDLAPDLRQRLAQEWRRCFEEWNYTV